MEGSDVFTWCRVLEKVTGVILIILIDKFNYRVKLLEVIESILP